MRRFILCLVLLILVAVGCSQPKNELTFRANGEAFVREGFETKDGWNLTFDSFFITVSDVVATQTDPPYDPSSGGEIKGKSVMIGSEPITVDLANGDALAEPIVLGNVSAEVGQYNALSWKMIHGKDGATIRLVGSAEKSGQLVPFDIQITDQYSYFCGEYLGDERKGFVSAEKGGDVEMTFHLDHIFGDARVNAADSLNQGALGFEPIAAIAKDGKVNVDSAELQAQLSAEQYATFAKAVASLGHVGEGNCYEAP